MTPVREAVLELTSALHNWRRDPSPENMRAVIVAGDVVSGFALDLEHTLTKRIEIDSQSLAFGVVCRCGHTLYMHNHKGGCYGIATIESTESTSGTGTCPCACTKYREAPHA